MGRRKAPGLLKRGQVWHIDKHIRGYGRLSESCGTGNLQEAERYLALRLEEIRLETVYGVRSTRMFREAATRYMNENMHKRSIERDARALEVADPFIGQLALRQVHMGTLQSFIEARRHKIKTATVNRDLAVVRRVLNLAARMWRDEDGRPWLDGAPLIQMLPPGDERKPYPLSVREQRLLFAELPRHLARMALFKVNTGTREQEVVQLRWDWEVRIPELDASVFVIPGAFVKNKDDRLVILNRIAFSVIEAVRGEHPSRVFTYRGRPVTKIYNTAWKSARARAASKYENILGEPCPVGFASIRVHDLKITFGRRLRSLGVSFEDRQDLLGHKSSRITTHYSPAEIANLIAAAEKVCDTDSRKTPAVTLIRSKWGSTSD